MDKLVVLDDFSLVVVVISDEEEVGEPVVATGGGGVDTLFLNFANMRSMGGETKVY